MNTRVKGLFKCDYHACRKHFQSEPVVCRNPRDGRTFCTDWCRENAEREKHGSKLSLKPIPERKE